MNWHWGIITAFLGLSGPSADSSALRKAYEAQAAYIEAQNMLVTIQEQIIADLLEERIALMWVSLVLMIVFNVLSYMGWGRRIVEWIGEVVLKGWDCLRKSKLAQWAHNLFVKKRGEENEDGTRNLGAD